MRDLVVLFIHFIATLARLLRPGGARSIVAESLLLKHQLLILNRSRQRAPNLSASDRILAGWLALWLRPTRLLRSAIVLKPSTLLGLHQAMCKQKYRMLFSPNHNRKPGPKGPSAELVHAVVEMKQRNPRWGCPRIAEQITLAFNLAIDKDVVRRILAHHHWPGQSPGGPSWLTFLGHMKESLWSMDLFRCESVTLRTHWVLVVMDQYTRRIIGFGVHAGTVDGVALCRMFNRAIRGQRWLPKYLSSDHDPLYKFHQWQANLRILEVTEIKTVPYVPLSHPFVERLIGTIRRTARFQDLLQPPSHPSLTGRANPGYASVTTRRQSARVSLAATLSRSISDTHGRLSFQRCALPAICRSPWAKTRNEIIRVGVLQFFIAARFVNLAVSLPQYQFASHRFLASRRRSI
jgi:transposase InsO family protein